jgi:hypothetical protein
MRLYNFFHLVQSWKLADSVIFGDSFSFGHNFVRGLELFIKLLSFCELNVSCLLFTAMQYQGSTKASPEAADAGDLSGTAQ